MRSAKPSRRVGTALECGLAAARRLSSPQRKEVSPKPRSALFLWKEGASAARPDGNEGRQNNLVIGLGSLAADRA